MSPVVIKRSGQVLCRTCRAFIGDIWRDQDTVLNPWWACWPSGEPAGFGPSATRNEAALDLLPPHECAP